MSLTKAQKQRIEEEETYRETVRKQNKGVGCFGKILLFIVLPIMVLYALSTQSSQTSNKSTATSTPSLSLVERIENRQNPLGKEFIIQGKIIKTGESWDDVYAKLGKPLFNKNESNTTYGLISEKEYSGYKLLVVRNTSVLVSHSCGECYIVYDIYPKNE